MRKRKGLGRVGIISVALLLSFCVMGVGYSLWSDTLTIGGTLEMGTWNDTLVSTICWTDPPNQENTSVACFLLNTSPDLPNPDCMVITIYDAQPAILYNCDFRIENIGTIPTIVQSITITASTDLAVTVNGIEKGTPIEPGESVCGTVTALFNDSATWNYDYLFTVTILTEKWNQYVP